MLKTDVFCRLQKTKNPCKRLIYRDKIHFSFSICGAGGIKITIHYQSIIL
nr:MAG TPA: hypothetical protein [Caudoviricetes sp.]